MQFPDTLVLGATGRIGRVLQHSWNCASLRDQVLWQGRVATGLRQDVTQVILDPIADPAAVARAAAGRQVLCLAGGVPGRGELTDSWRLGEAALRATAPGGRVVLCSSAAVYGNQSGDLDEEARLHPINEYGRAKVVMEQRGVILAAKLGVQLCVLRIGNIAGLDAILGGWGPGFQLDQFGDGTTPARSYIGVATLARVLGDLLALPQLPEVLNLTQPGPVEMGALLTAAGLDWTARLASEAAIARVALNTELLQKLVPVAAADAGQMVQEWHELEPHMSQEQV